jgi:ribosomal protein L12E/L44/L45/RPP1/RPP2
LWGIVAARFYRYSVEAKKLNKSLSLFIIELLNKKFGEPVEPVAAAGAAPAAPAAGGGAKKSGGVKTKKSAAGEPENALLFEK